MKATAEAKVPTCHRVAGTESVVGDIDETIANLAANPAASDVDVAQVESEAGLLEVDILELLFDCVPDGQEPDSGLGSSCTADADCEGGACANFGAGNFCGKRCAANADCRTGYVCSPLAGVGGGMVRVCEPGP